MAFQAIEQSGLRSSQSPPVFPREGSYADKAFGEASSGLFGAELKGRWRSRAQIRARYRLIWLGYQLLGEAEVLYRLPTRTGSWIRVGPKWLLERLTGANVPGWYDTHARHSRADVKVRVDKDRLQEVKTSMEGHPNIDS